MGLQGRSVEILRALDVIDELHGLGVVHREAHLYSDNGLILEMALESDEHPYSGILCCPQHHLEAVLSARFIALGGEIVRNTEMLDFVQDGQSVRCRFRQGTEIFALSTRILVGTDGAYSTVRQCLHMGVQCDAEPDHFVIVDCQWHNPPDSKASHTFLLAEGPVFVQPLPHAWRFMLSQSAPPEPGVGAADPLTQVADRLQPALGARPELSGIQWHTHFSVRRQLVDHYRRNRVFLAGDAAHVQSPVGGQGMNTGLADAFNLGWKLALYLSGKGSGAMLDSYEQERRPVAERMLNSQDFFSHASLLQQPWLQRGRDSLLRFVMQRPAFMRRLLRRLNQLDVHYRLSPLVSGHGFVSASRRRQGPLPGDRITDVALHSLRRDREHRLHELLKQPVHHLLLHLPEVPDHAQQLVVYALLQRIADDYESFVHVTVIADADNELTTTLRRESTVRVWHDHTGAWARTVVVPGQLWLMRPDGHLAYRAPLADADHLLSWMEALFAPR